jgi:hypothetical protein
MKCKIQYLKVRFSLGFVSVVVGFIGSTIALFEWVERTGVQYFFGEYCRYVLGFGGFAAMIFGALLVNDAWVLRDVLRGKYGVSTYTTTTSTTVYEEVKSPDKIQKKVGIPICAASYKERIIRNILRVYGFKEGEGGRLIRFFRRLVRHETD